MRGFTVIDINLLLKLKLEKVNLNLNKAKIKKILNQKFLFGFFIEFFF